MSTPHDKPDHDATIRLGRNQYGKSEVHMVTVSRTGSTHHIRDLTVSVALRGDLADVHYSGDNAHVVPTDTQKNTVFGLAEQAPVGEIEEFALRLGRHFVSSFDYITGARVLIDETGWGRIDVGGSPHEHSFSRSGEEKRTTAVTVDGEQAWVLSGLKDLVVLKSTGSEFWGYPKDRYTTLPETRDRILATAVTARWRHSGTDSDWAKSFAETRRALLETFAERHSLSLQQTLYDMGEAALQARPELAEVRMSMPNKHHFVVDMTPFGLHNDNEVFYAADRPYGLIEGAVQRTDAPEPGLAWDSMAAF